jgi:hypothetical protein
MGLARLAFKEKRRADAERIYGEVADTFSTTSSAPEAIYWRGVSHYRGTNDRAALGARRPALQQKAPESVWAKKAIPWLGCLKACPIDGMRKIARHAAHVTFVTLINQDSRSQSRRY